MGGFSMVHGSTATGSVPLILALGVRPFWVWGVRPPLSVSHLYPLCTLMLRVLRCLLLCRSTTVWPSPSSNTGAFRNRVGDVASRSCVARETS